MGSRQATPGSEPQNPSPSPRRRREFTSPSQGELTTYGFYLSGILDLSRDLRLSVGDLDFPIRRVGDAVAATWDNEAPASVATFSVRPTRKPATRPSRQRAERFYEAEIQERFVNAFLPGVADEKDFHTGWSIGMGFEGYDLVFTPEQVALAAAQPNPETEMLGTRIDIAVMDGGTGIHRQSLYNPSGITADSYVQPEPHETPQIFWHLSELDRKGAPTSGDPVIALLASDLSEVGISDVSIDDWRGDLLGSTARRYSERSFQMNRNATPIVRGYRLGRIFAECYRVRTASDELDERNAMLKSEFLQRLARRPYFQ